MEKKLDWIYIKPIKFLIIKKFPIQKLSLNNEGKNSF